MASGNSNLPPDPPCPPFGSKEIGSFNKLGTKVLAGYELQDGKCVTIWDSVPVGQVINNYVPDAGPTVSSCVDGCVCHDCGNLCQADCVTVAEACKTVDEESGQEDQSEAWP